VAHCGSTQSYNLVPIPKLWDRFSNLLSDRLESRSHRGFGDRLLGHTVLDDRAYGCVVMTAA